MGVHAVKRYLGSVVLVLLVALVPCAVVAIPPLNDYPFHIARIDLLARLGQSSFVAAHYDMNTFLLPDVGMDVAMLGLAKLMPVALAGKVFLGLMLASILTGTAALHAALHRRASVWPMLAAFFLYNWIVLFGFLNYLLGVGLMLWGVAAWIVLRERPVLVRSVAGAAVAIVLLFCHLEALGLFAVVTGGLELQAALARWRVSRVAAVGGLAIAAIPFVVALAVFLLVSPTAGEAARAIVYQSYWGWKPLAVIRTPLTAIPWLDILTLIPLAAMLALALWRRRIRLAAPMLLSLGLLVLTFIVMPESLFGSHFGDARLPVAILFVAIASTDIVAGTGRWWRVACLGALALLAVRSAAIAADWMRSDREIAPLVTALGTVPDGSTIYAATAGLFPNLAWRDATELAYWHPPLKHMVSLASIGRDIFVPATFADPFKQPIRVAPAFAAIKAFQDDVPFKTPTQAELSAVVRKIAELPAAGAGAQYLLLLYPELLRGDIPQTARIAARGAHFLLLRLD
jgi:hypothetical protein